MLQNEEFQIIYDGSSLSNGEIDVRDLAPALIAIGDLLGEANAILYGNTAQVQVNVKGSFKTGSFHVDFSLVQSIANQLNVFLNSPKGISTVAILGILGFNCSNGFGLLPFMKWLKNRKIKKITKIGEGKSSIEVDDESKDVEDNVINLYRNLKVRQSLEVIISKPLSKDGIDKFAIKYSKEYTEVSKIEKDYFITPDLADEPLKDEVRKVFLKALSPNFVEGNKWRFSDGNVDFFAIVKDDEFLKRVQDNKVTFSKDDTFEVELREKQWISDTGLKTDHEVERVLSHRSAAKQIRLPFEE